MKKFIKKCLVFTCLASLLITPSTALAHTSTDPFYVNEFKVVQIKDFDSWLTAIDFEDCSPSYETYWNDDGLVLTDAGTWRGFL